MGMRLVPAQWRFGRPAEFLSVTNPENRQLRFGNCEDKAGPSKKEKENDKRQEIIDLGIEEQIPIEIISATGPSGLLKEQVLSNVRGRAGTVRVQDLA